MTASCAAAWNTNTITGTYLEKGVHEGYVIYEKTTIVDDKYWFKLMRNEHNEWPFRGSDSQIVGSNEIGSSLDSCKDGIGWFSNSWYIMWYIIQFE